jgi:predicted ester cyclase
VGRAIGMLLGVVVANAVVRRFNTEVIEQGSASAAAELLASDFANRTAAPGMSPGPDGMVFMFEKVLRPALPDLAVEIHEQIAEGELVTTRKTLKGTHRGDLLGVAPTGQAVAISVIDIARVRNGQYVEHWGVNTLPSVLAALRG